MKNHQHIPVLLDEVIDYLKPSDNEIYVDCTFGAGGYSKAILQSANCKVVAIDVDESVKQYAKPLEENFQKNFDLVFGKFSELSDHLAKLNINKVDGIIADIGVSSMQIDFAERGFSFSSNGPLDMRMDNGSSFDASYVINNESEENLANIIYRYGDERKSRKIAKEICLKRQEEPITTTNELAEIVRSCVGKGKSKIDAATRTFQAIRIHVNNELEELRLLLEQSEKLLNKGGRLVIVSFHSLEDTIVKNYFKVKTGNDYSVSRHMPLDNSKITKPAFSYASRKAIKPSEKEIKENIRSRSARLRAIVKT